jgi:hypothetical protein
MMVELDRTTARAMVEAGYMPLDDYIDRFGPEVEREAARRVQASPWPRAVKIRAHFAAQRRAPYRIKYQKLRA